MTQSPARPLPVPAAPEAVLQGDLLPSAEAVRLIQAVAENRDKAAFVRLFGYFAPRLKSYMIKGGATPEQAEELVQETLLTVWQKAGQYQPASAAPSTWIFTIARNKRIDHLRRDSRLIPVAEDAVFEALMQPDNTDDTQSWLSLDAPRMAAAIDDLPPEQAHMVRLSYFENLSHGEIAARTHLPLGTIKSRLRLAMSRLRLYFDEKPVTHGHRPDPSAHGQGEGGKASPSSFAE